METSAKMVSGDGSPSTLCQIEQAAEIGMEHNLGLTCDPIGGLVQIPCIERNASGACQAWNSAGLARLGAETYWFEGDRPDRGQQGFLVSLDRVVQVMKATGQDMSVRYKETSLAGLAAGHEAKRSRGQARRTASGKDGALDAGFFGRSDSGKGPPHRPAC